MSIRNAIADALDGLALDVPEGRVTLAGFANMPDVFDAFAAWPVWVSSSWRSACEIDETWQVLVTLPSGDAAVWSDLAEPILTPVRDALLRVGAVTRAEPVNLMLGDPSSAIPALAYTLQT